MKQKTSVYLDDLDREAVQRVGEYYGITSDTDVLCFSVRAVARAVPNISHQKREQAPVVPIQDGGVMSKKQWQVDVYTSPDQALPHTFYDATLIPLREQVYSWLTSARPTYIRSGNIYEKEGKYWRPFVVEHDELAYGEFCKRSLHVQRGPDYEEQGMVDGTFRLEYVKTTTKHDDPSMVNLMIQRGWRILTLEESKETGMTWYVLGHTEEGAF
jgi:hypothetical protein